ncbi:two-component system response regulator YesN [Paenibacillus sp. V4I9]|uniref:AraC family transcriptional regulator n=1 Tax=Paenibacillus sp. V4I9 TaxID=3042308 RepID=UPI00278B9CA7|nr:AraC family transcriptional regulator [Paenibacillus sp. V4I9]MDQ0890710.1 two-component system response regulator YesN [Paenibacillus sp. V4I9]
MRKWYKKQLLSYFPLFLLTISIMVLLGLFVVSDISRKETKKANSISAAYVSDTMSRSLAEVQNALLKELATNDHIKEFVEHEKQKPRDEGLLLFYISESLNDLVLNNHLIQSIYMYRADDGLILKENQKDSLDTFPDREFVKSMWTNPQTDRWSDVRILHDSSTAGDIPVISLVKKLPIPFGSQGIVVINVDLRVLQENLDTLSDHKVTFLRVVNEQGNVVMSSEPLNDRNNESNQGEVISKIPISKTGWSVHSGIKAGQLFAWVSLLSYVWVASGIATIAASLGYLIYISKRNYRPIQLMLNKLESIQLRFLPVGREIDDLSFIGQAMEGLIEKAQHYEQQNHTNLLIRRRQLFSELINGVSTITEKDWEEGVPAFQEKVPFQEMGVIVAEMEGYDAFMKQHVPEDQTVLKLALQNIVQQFFNAHLSVWSEWISSNRLGIVYAEPQNSKPGTSHLVDLIETSQQWIEEHFGITFVYAGGTTVQDWQELHGSYRAALQALGHKLTRDRKALIMIEQLSGRPATETYSYWPKAADVAKSFRLTQDGWRQQLAELFADFKLYVLRDEDITMILETMIKLLEREIGNGIGASDNMRLAWEQSDLQRIVRDSATLQELEARMIGSLNELYRTYVSVCEANSYQAVIIEMRNYIEEHFEDPDLSLKHLSDRFGISGKNVSHMFKEAFGMKFVDFLMDLRTEKAKLLLTETELAQQDIAQQVGYSNSITFGRMFKRIVGVTPGDYRKKHSLYR